MKFKYYTDLLVICQVFTYPTVNSSFLTLESHLLISGQAQDSHLEKVCINWGPLSFSWLDMSCSLESP